MRNIIWKAAVTIVMILGCATLALRAGRNSATITVHVPSASAALPVAAAAVPGATNPQFGDSQCVSNVPRAWGQYRGGSNQAGLAFEASDGTLRFVTNLPCSATPVIALEVRRTPAAGGNSGN
jgi:hypothetical protein